MPDVILQMIYITNFKWIRNQLIDELQELIVNHQLVAVLLVRFTQDQ